MERENSRVDGNTTAFLTGWRERENGHMALEINQYELKKEKALRI